MSILSGPCALRSTCGSEKGEVQGLQEHHQARVRQRQVATYQDPEAKRRELS
jgi:hypothetical protein